MCVCQRCVIVENRDENVFQKPSDYHTRWEEIPPHFKVTKTLHENTHTHTTQTKCAHIHTHIHKDTYTQTNSLHTHTHTHTHTNTDRCMYSSDL